MAAKQQTMNVSNNPIMKELVGEVVRTRHSVVLRDDDTGAEVVVRPTSAHRASRRTRPRNSQDSFLASYQAIPSLGRRLSVEEMTQIAAEEHAQETAVEGL